ncbi:MAG: CapA family protein [Nitritalea sp.]
MIVLGDIAVPSAKYARFLNRELTKHHSIFNGKGLVYNLEGLVVNNISTDHPTPVLFNVKEALEVLKGNAALLSCIANNHTLDLPQQWAYNQEIHEKLQIPFVGAACSEEEAKKPVIIEEYGQQVAVFNHCWNVMLHHQNNPSGNVWVNSKMEHKLPAQIAAHKAAFPEHKIMVYMHWSYDLETLPFPAHREIAREMIDAGASLIVGTHAHCVQGGESYKNGYILYSIGNFFVPWHTFIKGHISFPDFARREIAVDWNPVSNSCTLHFFEYEEGNDEHLLHHIRSEHFHESKLLEAYSPFRGMANELYLSFFKKNRRKKGGVPIYRSFHDVNANFIKDKLLISRMKIARVIAKAKLRQWNN